MTAQIRHGGVARDLKSGAPSCKSTMTTSGLLRCDFNTKARQSNPQKTPVEHHRLVYRVWAARAMVAFLLTASGSHTTTISPPQQPFHRCSLVTDLMSDERGLLYQHLMKPHNARGDRFGSRHIGGACKRDAQEAGRSG